MAEIPSPVGAHRSRCRAFFQASSAESVGQGTASGRAILSVCGSASSTSWAPCEWPGKRAFMSIPPSCTSCPPCGSEFLLRGGDKNQSKRLPQGGQEATGGEITIGREQSASPSHLAVVGLDLCLVIRICRLENRQWSGFLLSFGGVWRTCGSGFDEIEAARGACPVIRLWPSLLSSPSRACSPFFHPQILPKNLFPKKGI